MSDKITATTTVKVIYKKKGQRTKSKNVEVTAPREGVAKDRMCVSSMRKRHEEKMQALRLQYDLFN